MTESPRADSSALPEHIAKMQLCTKSYVTDSPRTDSSALPWQRKKYIMADSPGTDSSSLPW